MENKQMKKTVEGTVKSTAMQHTVSVAVTHEFRHPLYRKAVKRTRKFLAHTDIDLTVGDKVRIVETKPISRNIHYMVLSKIS